MAGPDTDLTVGVEGRVWTNCDGTKNFPDGEIFTGPEEDAVNGHVRFSFPWLPTGVRSKISASSSSMAL
ncbi:MAG: aminopeptidase [Thermomicrobiales bacterium]